MKYLFVISFKYKKKEKNRSFILHPFQNFGTLLFLFCFKAMSILKIKDIIYNFFQIQLDIIKLIYFYEIVCSRVFIVFTLDNELLYTLIKVFSCFFR